MSTVPVGRFVPTFPTLFSQAVDFNHLPALSKLGIQPQIETNAFAAPKATNVPKHLEDLHMHMEIGGRLKSIGNYTDASRFFKRAKTELEKPRDSHGERAAPIHKHIGDEEDAGEQLLELLLKEIVLQSAVLSDSSLAIDNVQSVTRLIEGTPETYENDIDLARAHMASSWNLLNHAESVKDPDFDLYEKPLAYAEKAESLLWDSKKSPLHRMMNFTAGLLKIEILARMLTAAHENKMFQETYEWIKEKVKDGKTIKTKREFRTRDSLIEDIQKQFKFIDENHFKHVKVENKDADYDKMNLADANCRTDLAILFARLGIFDAALNNAWTLLKSPRLKSTPAAERLLRSVEMERFLVEGERIKGRYVEGERTYVVFDDNIRVKFDDNIHRRFSNHGYIELEDGRYVKLATEAYIKNKFGRLKTLKALRAALALAHPTSMLDSVLRGLGAAAGIEVVDRLLFDNELGMVAGIVGGAVYLGYRQIKNGWKTREVSTARTYGLYDRGKTETGKDIAKLFARLGLHGGALALPTALFNMPPESLWILWHSAIAGKEVWGDLIGTRIPEGVANLFSTETYAKIAELPPNEIAGLVAYHLFSKVTPVIFFWDMFRKKSRSYTKKIARLFILGAIIASADFGQFVSGESSMDLMPQFSQIEYWNRIRRAGIIMLEMFGVLIATGILSKALKRNTDKEPDKIEDFDQATINPLYKRPIAAIPSIINNLAHKPNWLFVMGAAIISGGSGGPISGLIQKEAELAFLTRVGRSTQEGLTGMEYVLESLPIGAWMIGIALIISGALKQQMPVVERLVEGWREAGKSQKAGEQATEKPPLHKKLGRSITDGLSGLHSPYFWNRFLRMLTWDQLVMPFKAALGMDTNVAQVIQSGGSTMAVNGMMAAAHPDASGSRWERETIATFETLKEVEEKRQSGEITDDEAAKRIKSITSSDDIRNFFTRSGQITRTALPLMGFPTTLEGIKSTMWPFYSIIRLKKTQDYPLKPNPFLCANVFQVLHEEIATDKQNDGGAVEELDKERFEMVLEYVRSEARDAKAFRVLQPLVKTFALARETKRFGPAIKEFFRENNWIPEALSFDLSDYELSKEELSNKTTRYLRAQVRKKVKISFAKYEKLIKAYGHGRKVSDKKKLPGRSPYLDGLFQMELPARAAPPSDLPGEAHTRRAKAADGA